MSNTLTINGVDYIRMDKIANSVPAVKPNGNRAQRLIDEFEEGSAQFAGFSIGHGIAAVLRHIIATEAQYGEEGALYAVSARTLEDLADALTAPTLLDRAMAGDATAARQFLHEAGFTDQHGQWLPQFQPQETND